MPAVQGKFPVPKVDEGIMSLLSASASVRENAVVVSLSNRSFDQSQEVEIRFIGDTPATGFVSSLAGDAPNSTNSAADPNNVTICRGDAVVRGDGITVTLAPCSVQTLVLKSK
jgi:alpha-L-arabinofuranosidase